MYTVINALINTLNTVGVKTLKFFDKVYEILIKLGGEEDE